MITQKDCKIYKLFLILFWDYREEGMDFDTAEIKAWDDANLYYQSK
jgi:hypothetical protein